MAGLGSFLQGAAGGMTSMKQMQNMQKQNNMMEKLATQQPGTQQQAGSPPAGQAQQPGAGLTPQTQGAQPQADSSWSFVKSLFGGNS